MTETIVNDDLDLEDEVTENTAAEPDDLDDDLDEDDTEEAPKPKKPSRVKAEGYVFVAAPTLTHESLAAYINEHAAGQLDAEVTPIQAQALLALHGPWQASPDRVAEREQEKAEKARLREEKQAALKIKREEAAKKKAEEAAKKKAKEEAEAGDDSDLDEVEAKPAGKTRKGRKPRAAAPAAEASDDDLDDLGA